MVQVRKAIGPFREALTKDSAQLVMLSPLEQNSRDTALDSPEAVQAIPRPLFGARVVLIVAFQLVENDGVGWIGVVSG